MAELSVQVSDIDGLEASYVAAAAGGDTFKNDGKTVLHVKNGSGGDITLTFTPPGTVAGVAIENPTCLVTAGEERFCGPFEPSVFNNSSGLLAVGYSGVTSLTIAAIRVP